MNKTEKSIIHLKNIKKIYGKGNNEITALHNINLDIKKGDMLAIMGPSGSGKSSLLNIIGLLDTATDGNYELDGVSIDSLSSKDKAALRNSKFGFIVQDFALVEKYTVKQNIEIPFSYSKHKTSKAEKNKLVLNVLTRLGIADKINELAYNLSGGQRQRVAIARALINNPEIILADEPTGALDSKNAKEIINILNELNKQGKTILVITHDKDIAASCNNIIGIKDGVLADYNTQ